MLKELYIENLAVIEKATIDFTDKLNVFTGETGAGKSILINGINAILGQRVTKDIVRTGTDKAIISARFTSLDKNTLDKLRELGITCDDGELFLTREISSDGGSVARVNSRSVNVAVLRELGDTLVNIHGQHDNQILLAQDQHIHILDSFADAEEYIADYRQSFRELQAVARKINKIKLDANQRAYQINQLEQTIDEIEQLRLKENEDEEIARELEVSKNAVVISEAIYNAVKLLEGDDDTSGAADLAKQAEQSLDEYTEIYEKLEPLHDRLLSAGIELADIATELSATLDKLNVDPKRYDYLNQRNDDIRKIKKKYGPELS
ncbi:MAG: AAA family ATPase, partial [Ruminococcus sp.]|nr:AAA family ATPase [Ruminococcus sp.]